MKKFLVAGLVFIVAGCWIHAAILPIGSIGSGDAGTNWFQLWRQIGTGMVGSGLVMMFVVALFDGVCCLDVVRRKGWRALAEGAK